MACILCNVWCYLFVFVIYPLRIIVEVFSLSSPSSFFLKKLKLILLLESFWLKKMKKRNIITNQCKINLLKK